MRTATIVQARMGSTRLPGKVLLPLGGHTVLEEVFRRVRAIAAVDVVICATSVEPEDDVLVGIAKRAGVEVVRGSAIDVLARYRKAAEAAGASTIIRVTSDCPLIDPVLCGQVLRRHAETNADYAANNMPPSYPHGLDCEVFTLDALRRADQAAHVPTDREHVTPWLRRNADVSRASVEGPGGHALEHRWTLDFPEDYTFLQAVFALLPPPPAIPAWSEVAAMLEARPEICALNAMRRVVRA
jgi:spore coat polysaccharide biosynthesis protein SpsF